MKLKHVELKGFKSFAKSTQLTFEKQITAIVGPNGSGKSNIAEAFRFVLGEQSMKSLRSKKTEDLLFNGSSFLQRVNRASVSLVFDNSKRQIEKAFDEIEIERVIHRDATNEYYINGSPARLKDITEMLAEAKIGSAGHHIISQGEADKMLSMTARERKEYLEEALGLTQYQNKKNDALKKLQKTEENLVSIKSLLRELAPHVRYLEREMKLIEKRKELSAELVERMQEYVQAFLPFTSLELKEREEGYAEVLEKERAIIESQQKVATDDSSGEYQAKRVALRDEISAVENNWNSLRREKSELERLIGRLETKIELLEEQSSTETTETTLIHDAPERLQRIRAILTGILEEHDLEAIRRSVGEALALTRVEAEEAAPEENSEDESAELLAIQEELSGLQQTITDKIREEDALLGKKQELEKELSETFQKEERNKSEAEKHSFELHSLEVMKGSLEREIESLKQSQGYFYASVEEVMLLTGARFSLDVKEEKEALEGITKNQLRDMEHAVERLKLKIEGMQVGNTKEVESEYTSAKEREAFLQNELLDLEKTSESLLSIIKDLDTKIETEFKAGVKKISELFSVFFSQMFTGGSAGLSIITLRKRSGEDEEEETEGKETGVEVNITMPHKKLRSIAMLSGGEKTLVSIALIFALSQVNPPPFLILDETDAALDEANSRRYGEALKELSNYSQLILITHNRETMSRAGMLYGITMGKASASELLSIDLEEAERIVR